jgi:hypothetical protein
MELGLSLEFEQAFYIRKKQRTQPQLSQVSTFNIPHQWGQTFIRFIIYKGYKGLTPIDLLVFL